MKRNLGKHIGLGVFMFWALFTAPQAWAQRLGDRCDPRYDTPPHPGWVCAATGESDWQKGEIHSSKKGDIILVPGCGVIALMLRNVEPPQYYSHTGIMVTNRFDIHNSTASEPRYKDSVDQSSNCDGFEPPVLKYGWPGTIWDRSRPQPLTIDEAFGGYERQDPEGKYRFLKPFSEGGPEPGNCILGDREFSPALVVHPPVEDDPGVRPLLEAIADQAKGIRAHYRWYAYTQADIFGRPASEPGGQVVFSRWSSWATPDRAPDGTMCSGLVWRAARLAGAVLEGDTTEPNDSREQSSDRAKDGLYVYTEDERKAAAEFMYDAIYNSVRDQMNWFEVLVTDCADETANQMVNAFAFDWCGEEPGPGRTGHAKDSDKWKNPGPGLTAAPDDILNWDPPPVGVYGDSTDLLLEPGRFIRVHEWAAATGTGSIEVTVWLEDTDAPVGGAEVRLGSLTRLSGPDGKVVFEAVASLDPGYYHTIYVEYQYSQTTRLCAAKFVTVEADVETKLKVLLNTRTSICPAAPIQPRRLVRITGHVHIFDAESFLVSDEVETKPQNVEFVLEPPDYDQVTKILKPCGGEEVRVDIEIKATINPIDLSLICEATATFYEGTDCDTDDQDQAPKDKIVIVKAGEVKLLDFDLANTDEGGDWAEVRLFIHNLPAPDP